MNESHRLSRGLLGGFALLLFFLGGWSLMLNTQVDENTTLKGLVFIGYGFILMGVLLRAKTRIVNAILISLAIVLLGGEIFTRAINPPPEDPDYRAAAPYIEFAGQPNGVIEDENIQLNALGYRDDVPAMPKPSDEYRVIMLGGSTVFNGSPRENSLSGIIEANFRREGSQGVKVYNWGVFGAVSGQELSAIVTRAVDYTPDMVLVYDGANDLTLPFIFDPRPGYPFQFMADEGGRRLLAGQWSVFDLTALLLRPSALGYTIFQAEIEAQLTDRRDLADTAGAGTAAWRDSIAEIYLNNWQKMCQLTRAYDFTLVGVLQPMIFFKDNLAGDEPNWLGQADYQQHTRAMYDLARPRIADLATDAPENCHFFDLSQALRGERQELFVDPVHLNDAGRRLMGLRLTELLTNIE